MKPYRLISTQPTGSINTGSCPGIFQYRLLGGTSKRKPIDVFERKSCLVSELVPYRKRVYYGKSKGKPPTSGLNTKWRGESQSILKELSSTCAANSTNREAACFVVSFWRNTLDPSGLQADRKTHTTPIDREAAYKLLGLQRETRGVCHEGSPGNRWFPLSHNPFWGDSAKKKKLT